MTRKAGCWLAAAGCLVIVVASAIGGAIGVTVAVDVWILQRIQEASHERP